MCSPTALAIGSMVGSGIGGLMQARGARQEGANAQAESEYRAAIERNNAIRADALARDAIGRGREDEAEERIRGRMLIGMMRAQLAAQGQVVGEGSAGELVADQAVATELDARTIRANAQREAQEFRIRASQFEDEASLQQIAGARAETAGRRRAAGTLIGTATNVASKWYQFSSAGAFG